VGQHLYVDDYFHIGQMHLASGKPCQDYSFSGVIDDGAFAVVSDGCSTGRHTDVGARIIALSTVNALQRWLRCQSKTRREIKELVTQQHDYALTRSKEALNLELSDMLATCLYVCCTPDGGLVSVQGDGVVAKVFKDGFIKFSGYQWENNTPLYPAYSQDNYKRFIQAHGNDPNFHALKVECCRINVDGSMRIDLESISLSNAIEGVVEEISEKELTELSFLAVFTDGVMQVDGINWKDVVLRLLAFKNVEGEFAKRRMIRFIKDSKKDENKRGPLDDISYAVIRIDNKTHEEG